MTLSTIDPRPGLVVLDLQKGIVGRPTVHPSAGVVRRSADLAARLGEVATTEEILQLLEKIR